MTTITIDRALLEQALDALTCSGDNDDPGHRCSHCDDYVDRNSVVRQALRAAIEQNRAQRRCAKVCEELHCEINECPEMALYCADKIRSGE